MTKPLYPDLGQKYYLSVSCPGCKRHLKDLDITDSVKDGKPIETFTVNCCLCIFEFCQNDSRIPPRYYFETNEDSGATILQVKELGEEYSSPVLKGITFTFRKKCDKIENLEYDLKTFIISGKVYSNSYSCFEALQ